MTVWIKRLEDNTIVTSFNEFDGATAYYLEGDADEDVIQDRLLQLVKSIGN